MKNRTIDKWNQYREIIVYLVVGLFTTIVGWGTKFLWNQIFYNGTLYPTSMQNTVLSTVNWVAGVAFAYPANRKWVFRSKNPQIFKEVSQFVISRLATWLMDILFLQIMINLCGMNIYFSTVLSAIIVVICNWIISKGIIFREKTKNN